MREKINFDRGWMFHKGDIEKPFPKWKGPIYESAKTERALWGPAAKNYDTSKYATEVWRSVDLPHDYVIEGIPEEKYNEALGFFEYDNAWYIKKFTLPSSDAGKRISFYFEGIATYSVIYLNGILLKRHFSGYTSFEVDITDFVKYDEENTLSIYVNGKEQHEGWWYQGAGIYRHVWLCKSNLVSVDLYGVFAKPVYENGEWRVETEVTLRNDSVNPTNADVLGEILDKNGNVVATAKTSTSIEEKDKAIVSYCFKVDAPELWSPESPTQYTMRTKVMRGGEICDEYDIKFGFRTLRIDASTGLYINEKHYKIHGLCGHADCGLMGKAVPDNIHRYKVELMKEMGANGYRTTHYPQAEALMDALDEAGFIVMNETRWFDSSEEGKAQLEMLMKRDRNRPGVIFWSIGNEEPHHTTEEGRRITQTLMKFARKLDDSRFIMSAVWHSPDKATVYDELELVGINYNWEAYNRVHEKYPEKAVISSENCATGTTRGWYFDDDPKRAFIRAYDHDTTEDWRSREYTWKFIAAREWMIGGYQWIAFEHRGEAVWPRLCSQSGAIDLFMQKKDAFYQNVSHWTDKPMVHLFPHWNFEGLEGTEIPVFAYTNAERLELYLNGKLVSSKDIEKYGHGEWRVPYEPGKIEVKAYNGDKLVASAERRTAKAPKNLALALDTPDISANGEDIAIFSCYVTDEDGYEVANATANVEFSVTGAGTLYSTGSDITDHTTIFDYKRRMREGRISVAVKLSDTPGELTVRAFSDNLNSAIIKIKTNK